MDYENPPLAQQRHGDRIAPKKMLRDLPPPPLNTKYVERQAGGHWAGNGDDLPPNLQHSDGTFLKLIRDSPRYLKELHFYESIFGTEDGGEDVLALKKLLPTFYGVFRTCMAGKEVQYLKLEDVTRKFRLPCLLDVKMKANIHDPQSRNAHRQFESARKMGFLLDGLQVYNANTQQYCSYQKDFGKHIDEEGVKTALRFYVNGCGDRSVTIVKSFLQKLNVIRKWSERQKSFKFYRSSLLFVYDASYFLENRPTNGLPEHNNFYSCNDGLFEREDLTDIRILDFPKVYESHENDGDFLQSIDNLILCFRNLIFRE